MKTLRMALGAALLVSGGAASAQSATDARCIVLSNIYAADAKEDNAKKLAEASFYFYLGRIGPVTSAQLKTLLNAQTKSITDATAGGLMNACIKEFQSKVQLVQSLAPQPAAPPKK
jgi:hypothetical protein